MTERTSSTRERLTITDLAIRERLGYRGARDRELKGEFGPVERVGSRLYVIPPQQAKPWVREVEGLAVERFRLPRERESRGRERWLSSEELARFQSECPAEWWPFFAMLFYTDARLGEVQGLRGGDILLHSKRLLIHEGERRVKTKEAVRDLPIPPALEGLLAGHLARVGPGPDDLVFPRHYQDYGTARRAWDRICGAAKVAGATPHDARHTFAVHAAMAGVPIVRLQKLLGHATATMTLRYMKHAPESYLDEDAAAIAAHMTGQGDREAGARVVAARREIRPA